MKAKKAIRKLAAAEARLADVIEGFSGSGPAVLNLLNSAKQSVSQARIGIEKMREPKAEASPLKVPRKSDRAAAARRAA